MVVIYFFINLAATALMSYAASAVVTDITQKALASYCFTVKVYLPFFANFGFLHIRILVGVTSTSSSSWMYSMQSSRL